MSRGGRRTGLVLAIGLLAALSVWYLGWGRFAGLPQPGSREYEEVTRAFYRALAELEVGLLDGAVNGFSAAAGLVPREPASWANLGLAHLRLGSFDEAAAALSRAAELAPDDGRIVFLLSRLETSRGNLDAGLEHLRRAVALDPSNVQARMALVQEIENAASPGADDEAQKLLEEILVLAPDNLAVLVERARLAAKRGDADLLRDSIDRLAPAAATWPDEVAAQFAVVRQMAEGPIGSDAAIELAFLRNVLAREPAFLDDRQRVTASVELIADPFVEFVRLAPARSTPDAADRDLTYVTDVVGGAPEPLLALTAVSLDGVAPPALFGTDGREIRRINSTMPTLPFPAGSGAAAAGVSLIAVDWNHDFRLDLAAGGPGGVFLYVQMEDGTFADATPWATARAGAPGPVTGLWAADVEMDGDIDLIAARPNGPPVVLRNDGNGQWDLLEPFAGVSDVRAFVWGDIDRDGDPDAVLLDGSGALHLFVNQQAGAFAREDGPPLAGVAALALADAYADGALDLVTYRAGGSIELSTWRHDGWTTREWTDWPDGDAGAVRLFVADLDNNGALDLVASTPTTAAVWLTDHDGTPVRLDAPVDVGLAGVVDLDDDGVLDLYGLADGVPARITGQATRDYHYQVVRPRAQTAAGDQRINSFGIGATVEVRSGLLVQTQVVTGPVVHVGLGTRRAVDVTRIVWPNGVPQAEFDPQVDAAITAEQRLKGSCPWVFADNGQGLQFITDFLWRSPLGLRINAADTAGVTQTEDWIRIGGDQLAPRNGVYDVRITAELWETHYIDHVALMVVDHPADVEVFVDERFVPAAPPALEVHAVRDVTTVADARDHRGRIVTPMIESLDGRYLATFARGPYQGIAEEHWVEFDVPARPAGAARWWIVGQGWVYPTDSSINVAIGQGGRVRPQSLALDVLDDAGRWTTVASDLGFPAGKNKTVLIDLQPLERAGLPGPRRVRLRTNLEIYWDRLATAVGVDGSVLRTERLEPAGAELRYRGYSATVGSRSEPETPIYDRIASTSPRWRDLVGYYTRFGDVRELVAGVDDRYVIMNAGDELALTFAARPGPPDGWTRDFVLIGDGWNKDGDFNTDYSKTVLPLPAHGTGYTAADDRLSLEADPVYQRHPDDWRTYHTRYVVPRAFVDGLSRRAASR